MNLCSCLLFYITTFFILDADEDQFLNENDLVWTLQRLTGGHLNKEEIDLVVKKVDSILCVCVSLGLK